MGRTTFVIVVALLAAGWWQRDALLDRYHQAFPGEAAPKTVYQWRDAQGRLQFGDAPPPGVAAKAMPLKPLNTVKGMSQKEIDATLKPAPAPDAEGRCEQDDPMAQARCIQAQTAGRNLAIERMEKALNK